MYFLSNKTGPFNFLHPGLVYELFERGAEVLELKKAKSAFAQLSHTDNNKIIWQVD